MLGEEIVSSWRRNIEHNRVTPKSSPASLDGPIKSSTPVIADSTADQSTASTPQPSDQMCQQSPIENLVNGNPKSPHEDNNNHHVSNNNIPLTPTMCTVNSFLRGEDALKSPYRFDDHRPPFKFAEELGMAPGSMIGRLGESLIPKGDPMEARLQEMLRYNMDKYASQNLGKSQQSRYANSDSQKSIYLCRYVAHIKKGPRTALDPQYRPKIIRKIYSGIIPGYRIGTFIKTKTLGQTD